MKRRTILKAIGAAAGTLVAGSAAATTFPSRPIRIVVPYGPSGLPDVLPRLIAESISVTLGKPVIVDNKPGASGIIGAQAAVKAKPDGHTIFLTDNMIYGINPAVFPRLPYDPLRDFAPVTHAVTAPMFLVANPSLGVKSLQEFVGLLKSRPGINYGSPGNATVHHLAMEQLALAAGIKPMHIPYKGVVQSLPGLLSGDVTSMFNTLGPVLPHIKAGRLAALAVGSRERSKLMPDVPTVAEAGYPGFEVSSTMGFAVPAGTPRPIIDQLNHEIVTALKSEALASRIARFAVEVVASTPEQFDSQMRREQAHFSDIVQRIGLKVE